MHHAAGEKVQERERTDEGKAGRTRETRKYLMLVVFYYSHLDEECSEVILRRDFTRGH